MANEEDKARRYVARSTSLVTAQVADSELAKSANGLTRKVLRAELVENPKSKENTVRLCLVHQKRQSAADPWADLPGTTLVQTKFNLPSKFQLDSAETRELFEVLCDLYEVSKDGVRRGTVVLELANQDEVIRTDAGRAGLIRKLLDTNHGEEVWKLLVDLQPELVDKLAAARAHAERRKALEEFETSISQKKDEQFWKALLTRNAWMFGSGNVAIVNEARLDIKHIADIPFEVEGGFMDIVELKRPDLSFWTKTSSGKRYLYRSKFLVPDHELRGAISQTTHYILQAEKHVSDTDFLKTHGVQPLKPQGLVVHGRSHDWGELEWKAFRLLNDNLHGIRVMTFDHLLHQARRAVDLE